jgi:hypothetical protein
MCLLVSECNFTPKFIASKKSVMLNAWPDITFDLSRLAECGDGVVLQFKLLEYVQLYIVTIGGGVF